MSIAYEITRLRRIMIYRNLVAGPLAMESPQAKHEPVMVKQLLDVFALKPGSVVADGTVGLGGHSSVFLDQIRPGGKLLGFDWDASMLALAERRLGGFADVELINRDFRAMPEELDKRDLRADAVLLDLGLNSAQVDDPDRGMSFRENGPLDMRMDRSSGEPASAHLNRMSLYEIEEMLKDLGDERWARAIARKIIERRKEVPLRTTQDLVDCVLAAIPVGARDKRIHPATRTFQAVRLYTTGELDGLDEAIEAISERLAPNGVLAVLSYHSGEDRIVKQAFRRLAGKRFADVYRKPQEPASDEVSRNPRSRSAKLRALRRNS